MQKENEMNLKKRAIAAHKEQQEYEAEKEADRFAKRAKATEVAFEKMFGSQYDVVPGTYNTVFADDGLKLRAVFSRTYRRDDTIDGFQLFGFCPDCGIGCYSKAIHNLSDLGKQVEDFESGWPHKCDPAIHSPTVGDRLLNALQDFIGELEVE